MDLMRLNFNRNLCKFYNDEKLPLPIRCSDKFRILLLILFFFTKINIIAQVPSKITLFQENSYRKSAEAVIDNYYSTLSVIQDAEGSDKDEIILNAINSSFVNENVMVCNDLDPTKKTEKYKKIADYLGSLDLYYSKSTFEYFINKKTISKIFYSDSDSTDKFLFVKVEVERVLKISYNDTVKNVSRDILDTTVLDVYIKFSRGKIGTKIYSIKEHEDNLSDFKLVTIDEGQSSTGSDTTNRSSLQENVSIKPGDFFFNSVPQGATVYFPDFPIFGVNHKTPITLTIPDGKYKVQLTKDNYDTIIDYISSADKSRSFKLVPNFSIVTFDVFPENSEVYVNGLKLNESYINGLEKKVPKGKVFVEIIADHYHKKRIEIQTLPGSVYTIKETLRPKNGLLTLRPGNSGAGGASVFIDNIPKGYLPFSDSLIEGRHTVRVTKQGYRNYIKSINLEENKLADFDVSLFSDVKLRIITQPSNAVISIDGKEIGNSNLNTKLSVGSHEIIIRKEFYQIRKEIINLQDDSKTQELYFYLTPLTNSVEVNSNPEGAIVSIGGVTQGSTPLFTSKEKGLYGFSIKKRGYFPRYFKGKIGGGQNKFHRKLYPKNVFNANMIFGLNSLGVELGGNISYFSFGLDLFGIVKNDIYNAPVSNEVARLQFDPSYLSSTSLKVSAKDTASIGICIKGGFVLLQPFIMRLHVGVGLRSFLYHKVYKATDNAVAYNAENLSATNIQKGALYVGQEVFSDNFQSLTMGVQIPFRHLNIGADYWFKTEKKGGFVFRVGYNFF
jgi:hypothetical protein